MRLSSLERFCFLFEERGDGGWLWAMPNAPQGAIFQFSLQTNSGAWQRTLTESSIQLPVIFLSGHGDISMSLKAIKSGAIEFLTKPVREQELLDAVQASIARDRVRREQDGGVDLYDNRQALFDLGI
jgi:FixJ family two-component response regulator